MPVSDYPVNVKMFRGDEVKNFHNRCGTNPEDSTIDEARREGWSLERPAASVTVRSSDYPPQEEPISEDPEPAAESTKED